MHQYDVALAATGAAALEQVASWRPDLVLLDLGLPGISGLEVIRRLREWSDVPIIVLSVRDREDDKVAALNLGADDYLTKPFGTNELLARIRVALRHAARVRLPQEPVIRVGDLRLELAAHRVLLRDLEIHLTPTEYEILKTLATHAGKMLTHRLLLQKVWGPDQSEDVAKLRVFMSTTRNLHVKKFRESEYPAMDISQTRSIEAFRRRLQRFVTAPLVQQLFCQPQSTIYLPDVMDRRQILIVKLVPEAISEELGTIIATTLLSSLAAATFARQRRETDPEQRWDWPLIIDEIQKFIDAEHPGDAEVFFTQTRSLGVGIHGAHQGLWQLGEAVQAAVLQSLGGLCVLGPIRHDARVLVEAYAPHGVTEQDFAGLQPRDQLAKIGVYWSGMAVSAAKSLRRWSAAGSFSAVQ